MDIKTIDYEGDGTFRPYTLNCAIYEVLKSIPIGGSITIDSIVNIEGNTINLATFRAAVNHIKKTAWNNLLVTTTSEGLGYPSRVYRAK